MTFSQMFTRNYQNFPKGDRQIINSFISHLVTQGFEGLEGRNKSSDNVPTDDPNFADKVAYAQQHNLWHYHIGIPCYETGNKGDKVSEYILHYVKGDNSIKIALNYPQ